jgi:hypothetical protein
MGLSFISATGPSPFGPVTIFYCLKFETCFSSPPTTLRVTVEVFNPASTRVVGGLVLYSRGTDSAVNTVVLLRSADYTENSSHVIAKHCSDLTTLCQCASLLPNRYQEAIS